MDWMAVPEEDKGAEGEVLKNIVKNLKSGERCSTISLYYEEQNHVLNSI